MIIPGLSKPRLIKKYGNRRLYDTSQSCYVTLGELEDVVREGTDIRVVDAKSGEDLTQATLVQIILDGRRAGDLLPTPLLLRLLRLGDDALAEFFGQYVGAALQMYLQAKQGFQMVNPLAALGSLGQMWPGWGESAPAETNAVPQQEEDISALRREIQDLRQRVQRQEKGAKTGAAGKNKAKVRSSNKPRRASPKK